MSTEFFNDQWRIPSNENQNKISNYSMEFDGANYVQIGPPPSNAFLQPSEAELNANGYSVSAWIKIDSSPTSEAGIFANDGIPQTGIIYGIEFSINTTGTLRIRKGDGTGRFSADVRSAITAETVPINAWTHVTFVLPSGNENTWQIYINGVAGTMSVGGSGGNVGYSGVYSGGIGRSRFNYFVGQIDQVTVFDYALSQDQVTQLGAEGYAFNFIPNDYIDLGTPFSFTQNLTVSLWVKSTQTATNTFIGKDNNTSGTRNWMVMLYQNKVYFWTTSTGTIGNLKDIQSNVAGVVSDGKWHHIVCVNNQTNATKQIYIDGVLDVTNNDGGSISTSSSPVQIGKRPSGFPYDGEMSNVALWDTALTGPQVATIYNNGKPNDISSLNPVAWYKLDDTATFNSSTSVWTIPDASTNSNTGSSFDMTSSSLVASNINGELITNPMITSPKPIAYYQLGDQSVSTGPTSSYLVPNNSLSDYVFNFDATNQSINLGSYFPYPSTVTDKWSFSCWVKLNSTSSYGYILSSFNIPASLTSSGLVVSLRGGADFGMIQATIRGNTSTQYTAVKTNNTLPLNEWKHVVATYDGNAGSASTAFTIYINGNPSALTSFGASSQSGSVINSSNKYIGQAAWGSQYLTDCDLSQLSFFNYELSSSQVETLYNNSAPGDISSLSPIAWWKLNASEVFNSTSTEWSVDNNAYPSAYQSSLNFNGSTQAVDCGTGSRFDIDQIAISAWVRLDSGLTNFQMIGGVRNTNNGILPYMLSQHNNSKFRFLVNQSSDSAYKIIYSNDDVVLNTWYHVMGVADGSSVKMYVNGDLQTDQTTYDGTITSPTQNFNIGRQPSQAIYYLDGQISNVAVFNTGLSQSQVQTIYNNGTPEASISHSPVSWWKLDNTTTGLIDNGSASNNGTNIGTTEYAGFVNVLAGESYGMDSSNLVVSDLQQTSGYSPYALSFDGINDYLDCGNTTALNSQSAVSTSAWVNYSGTPTTSSHIILSGGSSATNRFWVQLKSSTEIRYGSGSASAYDLTVSTMSSGTWYHIATVHNGTFLDVYLNGIKQGATVTVVSPSTQIGNNFKIGDYFSPVGYLWNGQLSNIALWNTELTTTQVAEIYNEGVPSNLNNFSGTAPVSWWQLGSNSSYNSGAWTCLDEIGTNNAVSNGSMTNDDIVDGPGYSASGLGTSSIDIKGDAPYSTANGLSENMDVLDRVKDTPINLQPITNTHSIKLDGIDDYIDFGDSDDFSFGDGATDSPFSISAWINMDDATRFRIASKFDSTSNSEYIFTVSGSDLLTVNLYDNSEIAFIGRKYNTALTSYQGQWIHVAFTYNGTSSSSGIKLYLNGSKVDDINSNSGSYTAMENTTQPFYIGRQGATYIADGKIDEVAIFNVELTGPQVAAIYNGGTPNNILPLSPVLWSRFESLTTSGGLVTTADSSGNGLTGTVKNGAVLSTNVP